jgi:hypothetical protein
MRKVASDADVPRGAAEAAPQLANGHADRSRIVGVQPVRAVDERV